MCLLFLRQSKAVHLVTQKREYSSDSFWFKQFERNGWCRSLERLKWFMLLSAMQVRL